MIPRGWQKAGGVAALALLLSLPAAANGALDAARKQFEAGKYLAAARTLQAALQGTPQDAPLHYWLGRCYFEMRDVDQAVREAERAVQLDPQNSDYQLWLGRAYGRKADRDRSLSLARATKRAYERAVRLDPSSIPARRSLMDYLSSAPWIAGGSDGKAREQVEAISAIDPVAGHLAMADYWQNNGKPDRAAAEFQLVLEQKPARVDPLMEVARFYEKRRDVTQLHAAIDAAARVDASDGRLDYFRGVAAVLSGSGLADGERHLLDYLRDVPQRSNYPSHSEAHLWLGKLYEGMGKCDAAADHYRAAVRLNAKLRDAKEALDRLKCSQSEISFQISNFKSQISTLNL